MTAVGIEALNVYGGSASIGAKELFTGRGLDLNRYANVAVDRRAVGLPIEDPVTNAVNAAKPMIDGLAKDGRDRIEMLIVCTESGLDYSKSVASYVHRYLGLGPQCRLVEAKQACYSATAALQLAVAYVASGISPGGRVLVVATDVSLVDERAGYAEPATGGGAVAILVGENPAVFTVDVGAFGNHSFETMDSARPTPETDQVDVDQSLLAYLDCLVRSFQDYQRRVEEADFAGTFDYLAMHTPFPGMVRAGHRAAMRQLTGAGMTEINDDFERRVTPSLRYPSVVGNMFAGSLYLALASLIDIAAVPATVRIGMYSYGSGCCSEFFSGLVDQGSAVALAAMRIGDRLERRAELTFDEYVALLPQTTRCLVPQRNRDVDPDGCRWVLDRVVDRDRMLALTSVRDFHRSYEWI